MREKHARPDRQSGCATSVWGSEFAPEILDVKTYRLAEIAIKLNRRWRPSNSKHGPRSLSEALFLGRRRRGRNACRPVQAAFPAAKGTILRAASSHSTSRRQLKLWSSVRRPTSLSSG